MWKFIEGIGGYEVTHENGVIIGFLTRDCDLEYNFWPRGHDGFWDWVMLEAIANKLKELNKPIVEEYWKWCEEHRKDESSSF